MTLACEGTALDARDRLVLVPTRAAAAHLRDGIEARTIAASGAVILPDLVTPRELTQRFAERLDARPVLTGAEREALLGAACRATRETGVEPPFEIRPGLISEILRFYDQLRLRRNSVADFERRALSLLEPGASTDRGAERLVVQTRFLATAFREFERQITEHGSDEHDRRERIATTPASRPYRHVVLTVTDAAFDPFGLLPADWDLLTRIPNLERLDAVVTDTMLAGALHERIHQVLPGIEEVTFEPQAQPTLPVVLTTSGDERIQRARDREEEVASFARRVKAAVRRGELSSPSRAAFIVRRPLPYVYVAREVMRSAGIPCQMFDALPLAAEPYAAALDLVLSSVSANFAREPAIALLRSPHFDFDVRLKPDTTTIVEDVPALDRALAEAGYSATRTLSSDCSRRGAGLRPHAAAWSRPCAQGSCSSISCASSVRFGRLPQHRSTLRVSWRSSRRMAGPQNRTRPTLPQSRTRPTRVGRAARGGRSLARSSRCAMHGRASTTHPSTATSWPR